MFGNKKEDKYKEKKELPAEEMKKNPLLQNNAETAKIRRSNDTYDEYDGTGLIILLKDEEDGTVYYTEAPSPPPHNPMNLELAGNTVGHQS